MFNSQIVITIQIAKTIPSCNIVDFYCFGLRNY